MFILHWDGEPPTDREEWIEIMREVFRSASGSYRIRFRPGPGGWRFELEWREDLGPRGEGVVARSPESMRSALHNALTSRGKRLDADLK